MAQSAAVRAIAAQPPRIRLSARLEVGSRAPFGNGASSSLGRRIADFQRAERDAAKRAAQVATEATRGGFRYLRPVQGAQRPGRESSGGRFPTFLTWEVDSNGQVALDLGELNTHAPQWIILEIGTGKSATMRFGGQDEIGGATQVRTVRSQRGRRISGAFVFASGPSGQYSPPGAEHDQQLYARSRVTGAPRRRTSIIIKREIHGQHFVQKGGTTGFREYRRSVLAAARSSFRRP